MTVASAVLDRRRRWRRARAIPVACLGLLASFCFFGSLFQRHNALLTSMPPRLWQGDEGSPLSDTHVSVVPPRPPLSRLSREEGSPSSDTHVPVVPRSPPSAALPSGGDSPTDETNNGGVARTVGQALAPPSRFHNYTNEPVNDETDESRAKLRKLLSEPVPQPVGLRHRASPPGRDAILGLAAYPKNMGTFTRLVGSLRNTGYDGHIIFGVHIDIPQEEEDYLKQMDVTYYMVEFVDCDPSILVGGANTGKDAVRRKCGKGYERLTLEWGRFEMARQWLHACKECTGWNLVMDTRDVFFQAHPFASLPSALEVDGIGKGNDNENGNEVADLLFIEEIAAHSSPVPEPHRYFQLGNPRYRGRTTPCYGRNHMEKFAHRPVLCSGTIIGTRNGMHRFLSVLVDEFNSNSRGQKGACKNSPRGLTDQWTMNYLYYTGRFGDFTRTRTVPWGSGPVLTIGKPCINSALHPNITHSQRDLIEFQGGRTGLILNKHEEDDRSMARIAPAVHQYDRCHRWIQGWFVHHPELFKVTPKLAWK